MLHHNALNPMVSATKHIHEMLKLVELDGCLLSERDLPKKFKHATKDIFAKLKKLDRELNCPDESRWPKIENFEQDAQTYAQSIIKINLHYAGPSRSHLAGYIGAWNSMCRSLQDDINNHRN